MQTLSKAETSYTHSRRQGKPASTPSQKVLNLRAAATHVLRNVPHIVSTCTY